MNDRLGDLGEMPAWAIEPDEDEEPNRKGGGDIEMGKVQQEEPQQPSYMTHFFREVESIKEDIDAVKDATSQITKINEEAIRATTTEKENSLSKKLKPLVENTNKRAKRTKKMLELLKEETQKLKTEKTAKESDLRWVESCDDAYTMRIGYCLTSHISS
jgi:t-SNARE complex subunit (syntaxin)